MKMRKQVLFLLFITVVSPIVLYTDRLGSFTSSINLPFSFDDFTARNEFIEDVSTLSLGGEVGKLNLLPQEPSNTLKEPIGIVYLENSTRSFPNSDVSTGENSKEINESEKGELKTRVLSATEDENPIKQVTSEVHEENESDTLENPQSTEEEEHTEGLEDSEKEDELSLSEDATDNASEMENKEQQSEQISDEVNSKGSLGTITPEREKGQIVMPDVRVRQLRDQLIRARVYLSLGATRSNPHFVKELRQRIKEVRRALGIANKDSELPRNANDKLRAMEETLAKGKQIQNDCTAVIKKLRAILHSTEEQLRVHKKQTIFLTQLAAKTIPKGLHCLPLRLSTEYFSLNTSEQQFPNHKKLEDPNLYHYALFTDNILASAVVINSTISHAKDPKKHVFHIVTDRLNYAAMRMWFLVNPPGKATVQVQNIEEFTWLNSSYSPVLKQLGSPSMIDYYFRAHRASSDSNLKYRNPKYLSILNHLRFYLPEIFPKLGKVLFLDDDIVVQKDLTGLWSLKLNGKVNGAVETCGARFHRFDRYLNFSNPLISKNFDPHACGWAYGMNIFDLDEWKKQNITEIYHMWQKLNQDRQLWKLGTLPPGLITFWKRTFPLNPSWHVLGLGYNPSVDQKEIERASVIHYNGNMKPWLEIGIPKYKNYWAKFLNYDQEFLRDCNINP